ncbi:C-type mannose receptor 2-like [Pangasianodon hypophthalmus]|uniref:C-type mannose receptor 2-like n=1 Tax=Pangasianodon hypophthalmus TaxID=310915 RepID=UPI002307FDED|nr:C-type mannose receptor 2-like [Pangasianodon hypophthalmus]
MKPNLFCLLCLSGIPIVLSVPRKYYLIQQGRQWIDAQAYCRATYTDLATIETNDSMVQLQNEAQRQQFSSSAWIGLYNDINSWRWSLGNEPLGIMSDWAAGEPDNAEGHEACAATNPDIWFDVDCAVIFHFVCFDDRNNGTARYIYVSVYKTWSEAQSYCRQNHTDLVSARDTTENSVIQRMISEPIWFGLIRDSWKWSDQTNLSTVSWMPGKPDNALSNENCGYLYNGQVADAQCSDIMPFFCYSVITGKKQIIRVQVRSSPDANDPAVTAATLEKIKQKLKAHGMAENTRIKWRQQPDGVVFHKAK